MTLYDELAASELLDVQDDLLVNFYNVLPSDALPQVMSAAIILNVLITSRMAGGN